MKTDYEMVIGLEVHAALSTRTKVFCRCPNVFGAPPNTQCCPVCTGMPGTLPVLNAEAVRLAVKAGLAAGCRIALRSRMERKNYCYPDLPKAYQISQYDRPLCEHGSLTIETDAGPKKIGITRMHLEEDAGKLIHAPDGSTYVDYNRCGVPLIEIVSEPDLRSAEEVNAYLTKLRSILLYAGVSDCRMNEGSLRCDVNLSVRKKGTAAFGTRTEMKNLNSFHFITKAIEYEFARQVQVVEAGEAVVQETRRYDEATGKTLTMRRKENADDYRYFPEPDLPPILLSDAEIAAIAAEIPVLPDMRKAGYCEKYGLTGYEAEQLVSERAAADEFEQAAALCRADGAPKLLAGLMLTEGIRHEEYTPVCGKNLAELADLLAAGRINYGTAKNLLAALREKDESPAAKAEREGLWMLTDRSALEAICRRAIEASPRAVQDYRNGKKASLNAIFGAAMRQTGGKAEPAGLRRILAGLLDRPE